MKKFPENWIFQQYTKSTTLRWIDGLKYFYFIRAFGGHANDGDAFEANFFFEGRNDLITKLEALGIQIKYLEENYSKPVIGKTYSSEEFSKFKNAVPDYQDIEQPGQAFIANEKMFVWVNRGYFTIGRVGESNPYLLEEKDFVACKNVEKYLEENDFIRYSDISITNKINCISKFKYPELFL